MTVSLAERLSQNKQSHITFGQSPSNASNTASSSSSGSSVSGASKTSAALLTPISDVSSLSSASGVSDKTLTLPQIPVSIVSMNVQGGYHPDWSKQVEAAGGKPKAGGMAEVEHNIASQMKAVGTDWRTMCPMFKGMETIGFQPTGLSTTVKGPDDKEERYELLWIEKNGRIKYALKSDSLSKMKDIEDIQPLEIKIKDLPETYQDEWLEMHRQQMTPSTSPSGSSGATPIVSTSPAGSSGATPTVQLPKVTDKNAVIKMNQEIVKLNQAMAALVTQLAAPENGPAKPWQIAHGPDAVIVNDHMNGQALAELADKYPDFYKKTTTVFYTHNTYGPEYGELPHKLASFLGIAVPKNLHKTLEVLLSQKAAASKTSAKPKSPVADNPLQALWHQILAFFGFGPTPTPTTTSSTAAEPKAKKVDATDPVNSLRLGMRLANITIVNERFKDTILGGRFGVDNLFQDYLAKKDAEGLTFNMHHAVSPHMTPVNNDALKSDGYEPMPAELHQAILGANKASAPEQEALKKKLKQWKTTNKLALQKQMGLKPDPDAVLYGTLVRFGDPRQKGSLQLAHTLEKFLAEHPKAQFIIPAKSNPKENLPAIEGFIQAIQHNPDLKDRVSFQGWMNDQATHRVRAGCDYLLTVSNYEPYGLSQLEPMMTATVPIVSGRDGLFATVSDPHVLPTYNHTPGEAQKSSYGQTGYMVDNDMMPYLDAIDRYKKGTYAEFPSLPVVRKANKAFLKTLKRTYKEARSGDQLAVAMNDLRYVNAEHSMNRITEKYYVPLLNHILAAKQTPKLAQTA